MNLAELSELFPKLQAYLSHPAQLWQLAVLGTSLVLAWFLSRQMRVRLRNHATSWQLGVKSLDRVAFPLAALLLVLVGRAVLGRPEAQSVLNVAIPLLASLVLIRIAVYLLRRVFPPSEVLKASERIIVYTVWAGVALHITGVLPEITGFLDEIAFSVGRQRVSLLLILQAAITVVVTLLIALWVGRILENRVMGAAKLDLSLRVVLTKLIRALLLVLAVLIALPAVGIDLTLLSVFGGALGVGLGFGLQKIAANYVSGFIILLDRSIRIGDAVTVDNRFGTISQMKARYTVLKALDGTEAIIPNETLIASTVVNHTHTDPKVLVKLPVQVSYQCPLEEAMRILVEATRDQERVLRDPEPAALIKGFGESGINLELVFWIADPERGQAPLLSELYLAVWRAFQAQGIGIPYPQREVRVVPPPGSPAASALG